MTVSPGYQRFFAELKRRRVFRVMAVYGVVAFAVLQVADILVPALQLPESFVTGIAVLAILGFPCNQFGHQEPGTNEQILQFCQGKYNVKFDMFDKIEVNDEGAAPLYKFLTGPTAPVADKGPVKWNFEKFLFDRNGHLIARYRSKVTPQELEKDIEAALAK